MAPPTRHLSPSDALPLDRLIWKACAGPSVQLPPVQSLVYYFPQGHAEHADQTPVAFSPRVYSTPCVRCRVLSLEYLARADTDEVFVKLRMMPVGNADDVHHDRMVEEEDDDESVTSFAKVLTSSDANNGGGFSMPKACSAIFPKLDFQADPPVQQLSMFDLQGKVWEFRHIYRGLPLRHLLTTGWSRFVNSKKLIRGDSVVFIHDTRSKTFFISARRSISHSVGWTTPNAEMMDFGGSFSRRALGKVPKEEVIEAAERAVAGEEFGIVYYPGGGLSNFVVNAELVERTRGLPWRLNANANVKVKMKMSMETEEPARGTVVALSGYDKSGTWDVRSPWRMLKIHWDDPKIIKDDEWISPWELEIDNLPIEAERMPEIVPNAAAASRFNINLPSNTQCAEMEGVRRDDEPIPCSGAPEDVIVAQNDNLNSGPASEGNNAHRTGSFKLFGKIISYNGPT